MGNFSYPAVNSYLGFKGTGKMVYEDSGNNDTSFHRSGKKCDAEVKHSRERGLYERKFCPFSHTDTNFKPA